MQKQNQGDKVSTVSRLFIALLHKKPSQYCLLLPAEDGTSSAQVRPAALVAVTEVSLANQRDLFCSLEFQKKEMQRDSFALL